MSSAFDPSQGNGATYRGAPPARAFSAKADTAYYIDGEGVIVRAHGHAGYRDLVRHYRKRSTPTGLVWVLAVVLAWAALIAFAAAVYEILSRVWP